MRKRRRDASLLLCPKSDINEQIAVSEKKKKQQLLKDEMRTRIPEASTVRVKKEQIKHKTAHMHIQTRERR